MIAGDQRFAMLAARLADQWIFVFFDNYYLANAE
jgi:hypothetical protein